MGPSTNTTELIRKEQILNLCERFDKLARSDSEGDAWFWTNDIWLINILVLCNPNKVLSRNPENPKPLNGVWRKGTYILKIFADSKS